MNDLIVDEVRRVREAYAARFNYDLDAIYRDIKEQEKKSGREFVSPSPTEAATPAPTDGPSIQAAPAGDVHP